MSAFFLSDITGEPHKTLSPSFTRSLGENPLKSVGWMATMSGVIVLESRSSAAPSMGMSRPLFKTMFLDILSNVKKRCEDSHFFRIFEPLWTRKSVLSWRG